MFHLQDTFERYKNEPQGSLTSTKSIPGTNIIQVEAFCQGADIAKQDDVLPERPKRKLKGGIIAPASEPVEFEIAEDHTPDPIKSLDTIATISEYLIRNGRYRDNMLFIIGINFGLRISDLLTLAFTRLIDNNMCFRASFPMLEKKTSNTRKVPKNRIITINDAVVDAVTLFLENTDGVKLSDYMFKSESNNGKHCNRPMHRVSADRLLKGIAEDLNLDLHLATHTLRKTFGYHQMRMSGNSPRKLELLQQIFGHSSVNQTLKYIGITRDEISDAYMQLNLGSRYHYLLDSEAS